MADHILLIDDNEQVARLGQMILETAGLKVTTVESAELALETVKTFKPDLFLVDLQMGGMNGIELIRHLRANPAFVTTPIIIVTSVDKLEVKAAGFEAGADDYITKPYQSEELVLRVNALLRRFKIANAGAIGPVNDNSRVVTVFSLRGGSGCTTLAINLAATLSKMWGFSVPLVDFARPIGACDIATNLHPKNGLGALLAQDPVNIDVDMVESCLIEHTSGIRLLGGIVHPEEGELMSEAHASAIMNALQERYKYIVVDTSHTFGPETMVAFDAADAVLMPVVPDIISIRLARTALQLFEQLGYEKEYTVAVVNWVIRTGGLSSQQIEKALDHPIKAFIRHYEDIVINALNRGVPVVTELGAAPIAGLMEDLAWHVSLAEDRTEVSGNSDPYIQRIMKRNDRP